MLSHVVQVHHLFREIHPMYSPMTHFHAPWGATDLSDENSEFYYLFILLCITEQNQLNKYGYKSDGSGIMSTFCRLEKQ